MDERQSPPPYLESQRRASSAASRSLLTSLWPTCWGIAASAAEAASFSPASTASRATELSAGDISHREAGVAYALTAKDPARLCQMPPPPARRPARSSR